MTPRTPPVDDAHQWVTALGDEFGWALRAISTTFQTLATDSVAGIPGGARGYLVLVAVSRSEAPSQLALAARLSIDKTQMTGVLDALEAGGLAKRTPDPDDRRARLVRITPRGRRRLEQAKSALAQVEERVLAPLRDEERAVFRDCLSRIASGLIDAER
jgi:DNA-binding MarR family transcriptional regulator